MKERVNRVSEKREEEESRAEVSSHEERREKESRPRESEERERTGGGKQRANLGNRFSRETDRRERSRIFPTLKPLLSSRFRLLIHVTVRELRSRRVGRENN